MIKSKQDLKHYLSEDWKRNMHTEKPFSRIQLLKGFVRHADSAYAVNYLRTLRKYEYSLSLHSGIRSKIVRNWYKWRFAVLSRRYDIRITPNAVGFGLYLPHVVGGGIIIVCKSMGNYCVVNTQTVIGIKNSLEEVPEIGDNCEINSGARIFGKIRIGDNVKIGPNTVVFKDVPSNAVVSGVPARLIVLNGVKVKNKE